MRLLKIVLLSLGLSSLQAQDFTAKCVGTDGDTITVLVGAEQMKIRLEGIDARRCCINRIGASACLRWAKVPA